MTLAHFVVGADALAADRIAVGGDEGRHAAVVRRVRVGERVVLTDGLGAGAECVVVEVSRSGLVAEVARRLEEPAPSPRLVVVQAIPKGEHADRAVDLLTEVGVDVVVPWQSERGVAVWKGERREKGVARWRAVAQAAGKQSRRLRFPEIGDVCSTSDVCALVGAAGAAVALHEGADRPIATVDLPAAGDIVVVVGPEGGLSDAELEALSSAGAVAVRLGPSVLRSSSAGVVAAAAILSRTDRWR